MPGLVHVVVFSNFEGFALDPAPAIAWFEACAQAHPLVRWTHLYNPRYLLVDRPEMARAEAVFSPYLLVEAQTRGRAEIGLHLHLFYDLVRAMGISPRTGPFVGDQAPGCNGTRTAAEDARGADGGYDVLLTGYAPEERAAILDRSVASFLDRGFRRPTAFCAGYSAADPALQALLADRGFSVSFAAQALGPSDYGRCWYKLLEWYGHITPLTLPYRVARHAILPPPHPEGGHLELVEVPLNLAVDANELYMGEKVVAREEIFDAHCRWAQEEGRETCVAIGVHTEVIAGEQWPSGRVARILDRFLRHVARRAGQGEVEINYGSVTAVAGHFWENKTLAGVRGPIPPNDN